MTIAKVNSVDLSAKLLASENISVRRARAQTASFDITTRVLTLPMWKDLSPVVEGMLVGHEIGHALYTSEEYLAPIQEDRKIMSYLNVLEDVRIEKLVKRKYPGIRKTMTDGYKELNDKDFFGIKKIPDINTLNLIDRINLYFKAGLNCGVKFTVEEKLFVARAEKTETVEEVIALAREVYTYSKSTIKQQLMNALAEEPELEEDFNDPDDNLEEDEDFSNDWDDSEMQDSDDTVDDTEDAQKTEEKKQSRGAGSVDEKVEEELESQTTKNFDKKLEELADDKTEYKYYTIDEKGFTDPLVSYKRIIQETTSVDVYESQEEQLRVQAEFNKFKTESSRVVNYLIKEFEMRKSATLYKRAQTSKIGSLDMKKIWSYTLNEDLFKRVTTMPQGKNHGMIFLLDWSGSMQNVIKDTVQQVVTLAMFCHRAQIPYQVMAFADYDLEEGMSYEMRVAMADKRRAYTESLPQSMLNNGTNKFALLELLSSKMSNVEFTTMTRRLNSFWRFQNVRNYGLGGTPLNEAVGHMVSYIPKFIKANNIEKMSLITLTDGQGSSLYPHERWGLEEYRIEYGDGYASRKRINLKHFIQDPVTKKSYEITRWGQSQTEAILRMIKDRYDINSVGFYICRNSRNELSSAVENNVPSLRGSGSHYNLIEQMRRDFRDKGFYSLKNTGRDDLFIVPQNSLKIEDAEMEVNEKHSAKQIAKNFSKVLTGKKTSRVLLNQFIGYVA